MTVFVRYSVLRKIILILALTGVWLLVLSTMPVIGRALVSLNPNPGTGGEPQIPSDMRAELEGCDAISNIMAGHGSAFAPWISVRNQPWNKGTIEVPAGTTSVDLQLNYAMTACIDAGGASDYPPNGMNGYWAVQSQVAVRSAPSSVSLSAGDSVMTYLDAAGRFKGSYRRISRNFTFQPPGGFPTSGAYSFQIDLRPMQNVYNSNNGTYQYSCLRSGLVIAGWHEYDRCLQYFATFTVNVTVVNPVSGTLDCSAVSPTRINVSYGWNNNSSTIRLRRGTASSGEVLASSSAASRSPAATYNDTGRSPNTTYSYSLWSGSTRLATASCRTPVPTVTCTRTPATIFVNQSVTYTVGGTATGTITWSGAVSGTNASPRTVTYTTTGSKNVTVTRQGVSTNCPSVTVNPRTVACSGPSNTVEIGAAVTFNRTGGSNPGGTISWSGGGSPSTGTGNSFTTTFNSVGVKTINISQGGATGTCTVSIRYPLPRPQCYFPSGVNIEVDRQQDIIMTVYYEDGPPSGNISNISITVNPDGSAMPFGGTNINKDTPIEFTYPYTGSADGDKTVSGSATLTTPNGLGGNDEITATCSEPMRLGYKPYMKVFGGDVRAGSLLPDDCTVPSDPIGAVHTFADLPATGGHRGSSSQFTITALMSVNENYSASHRSGAPSPAKGLTLANSNGAGSTDYGGGYGDNNYAQCLTDYYGATREAAIEKGNWNGTSSFAEGEGRGQYNLSGSTIGGNTIPRGAQVAVYVDGNVFINGNIVYSTAGRAQLQDIPNFQLIVRGNIYIAPGVSRLDGLYIAQPVSGTEGGIIYTCSPGVGATYAAGDIFASCQNPLAINGAVVAKRVKFLRTFSSLIYSTTTENISPADGTNTNAAEIINYSPEMYLAPSAMAVPETPDAGVNNIQSIIGLPPVW